MQPPRHPFVRCAIAVAGVVWLFAAGFALPSRGAQPDRAAIRDTLKRTWDALDTLEVKGEEYTCKPDGQKDPRIAAFLKWEFAVGSGGRRSIKLISFKNDGTKELGIWTQQDGRKEYSVVPFSDDLDVVDYVGIRNQLSTHEHQDGVNVIFSWLWLPGYRPLYARIDDGAKLETVRGSEGEDVTTLSFDHAGAAMRCELDPAHDWIPRRVERAGKIWAATRFRRESGLWFAVEGISTDPETAATKGHPAQSAFRVDELSVNQPVPPTTFGLPTLPDGAKVIDLSGKGSRIIGGPEARKRLEEKHRPVNKQSDTPPVSARRDRPSFPWNIVVIALSLTALISAWAIWFIRGSQSSN